MNPGLKEVDLQVGGNPVISASASTVTDSQEISRSLEYSIVAVKSGTDGDPQIEIEGSADNVSWINPYTEDDGVTAKVLTLDLVINSAMDSMFPFKFIRISTIPNGTTQGTLSYKLTASIKS